MIKFCPDLTSKEEVVPMVVGQGTFTRPLLHTCLQHKCVAYRLGKCLKYDNDIDTHCDSKPMKEEEK